MHRLFRNLSHSQLVASAISDLSPSQRSAYDLVIRGQSVMITGEAETGKSKLLRAIKLVLPTRVTFYFLHWRVGDAYQRDHVTLVCWRRFGN